MPSTHFHGVLLHNAVLQRGGESLWVIRFIKNLSRFTRRCPFMGKKYYHDYMPSIIYVAILSFKTLT